MFCNMCGSNIPDGVDFCPSCGADLRAFKQTVAPNISEPVTEPASEPVSATISDAVSDINTPETPSFSSASTTPMMDIPMEEAPEASDQVFDPESGTTVLTMMDMSENLKSDFKSDLKSGEAGFGEVEAGHVQETVSKPEEAKPFIDPDTPREHQLQAPADKVVTPAPVTGSSILSDSNVPPTGQQQFQPNNQNMNPNQNINRNQNNNQNINYNQNMNQNSYSNQNQNSYMSNQGAPMVNNQVGGFFGASIPEDYKPISPIGYIGYSLLYSIPIVGIIMLFINGFGQSKNINVKNYARSYLIIMLVSVVLSIVISLIMAALGIGMAGALGD
ncbi:MAG: zinc-ribbon domain-containing protein [Eubacterium sp.]|nr:zinc-ribbon domain-containing protein [Eubacterium sp.]